MQNNAGQQYFPGVAGLLLLLSHGLQLSFRYQVNSVFVISMGSGLEIATECTVANGINILLLVTKNSALVANMATAFLCADDE